MFSIQVSLAESVKITDALQVAAKILEFYYFIDEMNLRDDRTGQALLHFNAEIEKIQELHIKGIGETKKEAIKAIFSNIPVPDEERH